LVKAKIKVQAGVKPPLIAEELDPVAFCKRVFCRSKKEAQREPNDAA
jgi:hypothetical protein